MSQYGEVCSIQTPKISNMATIPLDSNFALILSDTNKMLWDLYKQQVASFWTVEEVDLEQDLKDWSRLSVNEQKFIKSVLSFFAISDGIVNANLLENFASEVKDKSSQYFYAFQMAMENIHAEMYSLLIDTYVSDSAEKSELFDGINTNPSIARKAGWCLKYTDASLPFQERLVAFAVVEGVFFSASFCSIFWNTILVVKICWIHVIK
jgi:ribonucleotide reductase beta subunit family protein with ferritin-like domain